MKSYGCVISAIVTIALLLAIPYVMNIFWHYGSVKVAHLEALPMKFYGQVVDGDSQPLPDVEVELRVTFPKWPAGVWTGTALDEEVVVVKTDAQGKFLYGRDLGTMLQIWDVRKAGYTWVYPKDEQGRTMSTPSFDFISRPGSNLHIPDPGNPYVLHMSARRSL